MEDLRGRPLTRQGGTTNDIQQPNNSTNSAQSQRQKILEWLQHAPLTTLQARHELFVISIAARIFELKERGHNIHTVMVPASFGGKRRIVCPIGWGC